MCRLTVHAVCSQLISDEIIDESDIVADNQSKAQVKENIKLPRLNFFEMLQATHPHHLSPTPPPPLAPLS